MDWLKILSAVALIGMMVLIFPGLKNATQNSKKGTAEDWMSFIKPMALVIIFVIALIVLSR
ncbi:MAG: hypothetical protein ISR69_03985 [Gammaproteobacteria bacterium]|nr:hypothetical protein [Gammaproteobacteria bacterium]